MEITINTNTLKIVGGIALVIVSIFVLQLFVKGKSVDDCTDSVEDVCTLSVDSEKITADQIEVVHFYGTQQCWACVVMGDYAKKTIESRFPSEYESGRIVFLKVNVDLPENSEIARKYRAYGSSLFINFIYDEQDHISEDVAVWRLLNSEVQFIKYLGDKLEKYL
jgi:hypothetical protein